MNKYKYLVSFAYANGFGHDIIEINAQINGMREIEKIIEFIEKDVKVKKIVILNIQRLPI